MIEAYLKTFSYFEPKNWARLLSMAEFAYNNAQMADISHTSLELIYDLLTTYFKNNLKLYSFSLVFALCLLLFALDLKQEIS